MDDQNQNQNPIQPVGDQTQQAPAAVPPMQEPPVQAPMPEPTPTPTPMPEPGATVPPVQTPTPEPEPMPQPGPEMPGGDQTQQTQ